LGVGCSGSEIAVDPAPVETAHVAALSTYDASIGTLIEAYGTGFPPPTEGKVSLVFRGTFTGQDGQRRPVELIADTRRVDSTTLRWTGFGPYQNPFAPTGDPLGSFEGTVAARIDRSDGIVAEDPSPSQIDFDVGPSVIVRELQPITASCNGGVLRALGGAPYRLRVEALGFDPAAWDVSFTAPSTDIDPIHLRTLARGPLAELGNRGDLILPDVPEGIPSYGAVVRISGRTTEGKVYETAFGLTVHRPIEVFYNGNIEVGEVLAPVPVSGCIPGGINGRSAEYAESESETRSRSFDIGWNQSWLSEHTVATGSEQTIGLSESNGVGFSTTDGESFNWSLGGEVSGSFGLDKLVGLGVKISGEIGGETSRSSESSQNRESGVNQSTSTTESESISEANQREQSAGFAWQVSSSTEISRGFSGEILPNSYGVFYRQTLRLVRRAAIVAYNQCGYAKVVGDLDFVDWAWSPDLGLGPSCPPLPASNLPPPSCLLPPCIGGS
jgi:hypothetical protein